MCVASVCAGLMFQEEIVCTTCPKPLGKSSFGR